MLFELCKLQTNEISVFFYVKMATGRNVNNFSLKQVKTIVESSPDYENITEEGVYLIAAATKYFLKFLATEAFKRSRTGDLEYKHVSEYIAENNNIDFLREIVPKKIKVSDLKEILRQQGIHYEFPPTGASTSSALNSQQRIMTYTDKSGPSTSHSMKNERVYVDIITEKPTTSYATNQENDSCSESSNSISPSPSYSSLSSEVRSTVILHDEASDNSESEPC